MNSSLSLQKIFAPLVNFFRRYHVVISILILAGSLTVAIFMLNSLIARSQQDGTPSAATRFDAETIKQINELQTREDDTSFNLPNGRINPFVE